MMIAIGIATPNYSLCDWLLSVHDVNAGCDIYVWLKVTITTDMRYGLLFL